MKNSPLKDKLIQLATEMVLVEICKTMNIDDNSPPEVMRGAKMILEILIESIDMRIEELEGKSKTKASAIITDIQNKVKNNDGNKSH